MCPKLEAYNLNIYIYGRVEADAHTKKSFLSYLFG